MRHLTGSILVLFLCLRRLLSSESLDSLLLLAAHSPLLALGRIVSIHFLTTGRARRKEERGRASTSNWAQGGGSGGDHLMN